MIRESTLTAKGQTTIPAAIRDCLGIVPGDRISFVVLGDGRVELVAHNRPVSDLFGLFQDRQPERGLDDDAAIARAVTEADDRARSGMVSGALKETQE